MIEFEKSCCFTGYRPEKFDFKFNNDDPDYRRFTERLISALTRRIEGGCTVFYTGMAKGFDIIAAEYIELIKRRNKNLKLIAVIPYKGQEKGWSEDWKKRYYELLDGCDEVVTLNEAYEKWVFDRRNRYMVDRCRYVITYFDGKPGGTGNTVKYALRNCREVINIFETDPAEKDKARYVSKFVLIPPDSDLLL